MKRLTITPVISALVLFTLIGCSSTEQNYEGKYLLPSITMQEKQPVTRLQFNDVATHPNSIITINPNSNDYSNLRRAIKQGVTLPSPHLTEWLNYFTYRYPKAQQQPISGTIEIAPAPWDATRHLMRIGINAESEKSNHPRTITVLVNIDKASVNKTITERVKYALMDLTNRLQPDDTLTIIEVNSQIEIAIEAATNSDRFDIDTAIKYLAFNAEENDNFPKALDLAYQLNRKYSQPEGDNLILLMVDDRFIASDTEIAPLLSVIQPSASSLITLTFSDEPYNYPAIQQLVEYGHGIQAYIDSPLEAERMNKRVLAGINHVASQNNELNVTFDPRYVESYRLLGYEEAYSNAISQMNQLRQGEQYTALYELILTNNKAKMASEHYYDLGDVSVKYTLPDQTMRYSLDLSISSALLINPQPSKDFHFSSAVAALALSQQSSTFKQAYPITSIISLAQRGIDDDNKLARREFIELLMLLQQDRP